MTILTDAEIAYLTSERRLARLATVGRDGTPHIAPVGWRVDPERGVFEVGGHSLAETKKFRDIAHTGKAAIVIDDVLPPWRPRGIEVRGRAESITEPKPVIRIFPERVISWGLEDDARRPNGRDVAIETG